MTKKHLLAVFFLIISAFFAHASKDVNTATPPEGYDLSESVYSLLKQNGFSPSKQEIASTGHDNFAQNIAVSFSSKNQKKKQEAFTDNLRYSVILDISQEDFYKYQKEILVFLKQLKSSTIQCDAIFLFSALTKPIIKASSRISGSASFASLIEDEDGYSAIAIQIGQTKKNTILTGTENSTTPLWLSKQTVEAFRRTDKPFDFPNVISSVYRIGLLKGENRMTAFIKNGIPAVTVSLSDINELDVISDFLVNYDSSGTDQWDQHYFFFPSQKFGNSFFINERFFLLTGIILAIVTIFLLCMFSFTEKNSIKIKRELLKNLYFIPLTLFVSTAGLLAGQAISFIFSNGLISNPAIQFGIKILISLFFVSIIFIFHNFFRIPANILIYSYLIQFIALFNIFVFSFRDIMFFILFGIEYLIIFFSRNCKKNISLIIILILMQLPFLPYADIILVRGEKIDLSSSIYSSLIQNFSIAIAIFPFQIIWLKILTNIEIFNRNKGYSIRKTILLGTVSTVSILTFALCAMLLISRFFFEPANKINKEKELNIAHNNKSTCTLAVQRHEFSGMATTQLKISSKENALRYMVYVASLDSRIPVYDSIYDFEVTQLQNPETNKKDEVISFLIPDYPPKNMTIVYASDASCKSKIGLLAFYPDGENNVRFEELTNTTGGSK